MIKAFFRDNRVHKKIVPNMDWIFLFNISYFFILWMVFCWGMGSSYYSQNLNSNYFSVDIALYDFVFFLGLSLLLGGVNIHNQLDDLNYLLDWPLSDENNHKKQLNLYYVCPNFIKVKPAKICSIVCIFVGVLIISMYSFLTLTFLIIYCYLNLFIYKKYIVIASYKHFVLRCIFILLSHFILFLSGWVYFGLNSYISIINYIPLFLMAVLPIVLINEVISYDKYSNQEKDKRTFIFKNKKYIAFLSLLLMSLLFCVSYFVYSDPITAHFSIINIPFLLYAFIRAKNKDYTRSIVYPIMVSNILLSWTLFPFLFVAQFVVFYLSKYYYWHRFNFHFPKFAIDENE